MANLMLSSLEPQLQILSICQSKNTSVWSSVIIKHLSCSMLDGGNNVREGTTSLTQLRKWLVISNLILQNISCT